MNRFFYNQPLFRIFWPPVYGAFVYLLILLLNNNLDQLNESFFGDELYFCIILSYLVFESIRFIPNRNFKNPNWEPKTWSIFKLVSITLFATAIIVVVSVDFYFMFILGFSSLALFSVELSIFLAVYFFSAVFYLSILLSSQYLYRDNRQKIEQEQILNESLELELMRFKNEINPELLYDSLETLIPLLHKNPEDAEDYIDRIALVYRHILTNRSSELIRLEQEVKAAKNIISLLNKKHHNSIKLNVDMSPEYLDRLAIPGALCNVVESIIRSTLISDYQPLSIQFDAGKDDYLVISHALNERLKMNMDDTLNRLQQAYSIFSEKPVVSVKAYGENFIKIPLLQLKEELA